MNGYKIMAESYRKLIERQDPTVDYSGFDRKIKILDFLGDCVEDDIYELYNSSAFNEITMRVCKCAMRNAGIDEDTISNAMREVNRIHDTTADIKELFDDKNRDNEAEMQGRRRTGRLL